MDEYEKIKANANNFEKAADREVLETGGLESIGIIALQDPLRTSIKASIEEVGRAGIQVIMATGDNIDTAIAISKNAGIITDAQLKASEYSAMTGADFREKVGEIKIIDDPEKPGKTMDSVGNLKAFREVKEHLRVLARSSPQDKFLLSTGLQQCGAVEL